MLLKGMAWYLAYFGMLPIFKSYLGLGAKQLQIFTFIVLSPWSIKPLIGLCSDMLIIGGMHKRFWLIFSLGIGCLSSGLLFLSFALHSPLGISLCFFGINLQIATFDLLSEGAYSALVRDNRELGSDVSALTQSYERIGGIIGSLCLGLLADHQLYNVIFALLCVFCTAPLLAIRWMPEERVPECCGKDLTIWNEQRGMVLVIGFMALATPVTDVISQTAGPMMALAIGLLFLIAAMLGVYAVFPRIMANVALFQVATSLAQPRIGSYMDFWYLADPMCVPNGPHFDYTYFQTLVGLVGTAASLLGIIVFTVTMRNMRFRIVLNLTAAMGAVAALSDIFLVTRANVAVGISDRAAYIVGEAIMEPVIASLNYIPASTLISKVVLHGFESSCFALVAGMSNFAGMLSELSGTLIAEASGVVTTGTDCNFAPMPWLLLICNIVFPLLVNVTLGFLIIPNIRQTDDLTVS